MAIERGFRWKTQFTPEKKCEENSQAIPISQVKRVKRETAPTSDSAQFILAWRSEDSVETPAGSHCYQQESKSSFSLSERRSPTIAHMGGLPTVPNMAADNGSHPSGAMVARAPTMAVLAPPYACIIAGRWKPGSTS